MTNFIEELNNGDSFEYLNDLFILSMDYKKDGSRLGIDLRTGNSRWFKPDLIINKIGIFYTDRDSNIIAIKELSKKDVNA